MSLGTLAPDHRQEIHNPSRARSISGRRFSLPCRKAERTDLPATSFSRVRAALGSIFAPINVSQKIPLCLLTTVHLGHFHSCLFTQPFRCIANEYPAQPLSFATSARAVMPKACPDDSG